MLELVIRVVEHPRTGSEHGLEGVGGAAGWDGPLHPQSSSEGAPQPQTQAWSVGTIDVRTTSTDPTKVSRKSAKKRTTERTTIPFDGTNLCRLGGAS